MEPQEKRNLITRSRNQLKIDTLELIELDKECFKLLQVKYKMQEHLSHKANELDKLEREWFYESGRVKKDPPPKERSTKESSIAEEFGLTPTEAIAIIRKAVEEKEEG